MRLDIRGCIYKNYQRRKYWRLSPRYQGFYVCSESKHLHESGIPKSIGHFSLQQCTSSLILNESVLLQTSLLTWCSIMTLSSPSAIISLSLRRRCYLLVIMKIIIRLGYWMERFKMGLSKYPITWELQPKAGRGLCKLWNSGLATSYLQIMTSIFGLWTF